MLVNLAIITHLCHHSGITSQGMESVYTHFQHIQPSCVCSATWVHPTITISFVTWSAGLQETVSWTTPRFLKETSVSQGQSCLAQKEKHLSPPDTAELMKKINFHWHKKWVLWWIEWMLREIQDHLKLVPFFIMLIISQPQASCLFLQNMFLSPRAHIIPFWESSEENELFLTGIRRHHFRKPLIYHSGKTRALEE